MIFIALLILIVALLAYAAHRSHTYWLRRGIPHDKPKFPNGNFNEWPKTKQFSMIFRDYYNKYKSNNYPFAGFYLFFTKTAIITDLNLVKDILIKDFNNFNARGGFYNEVDDPLSAHLISIEGQQWRQLRHKLTPTFTSGKMKFMFPTVVAVGQQLAQVFENHVHEAGTKSLEVTELVARYTADVIGTCAFGLECNSLSNPKADFVVTGRRAIVERAYGNKLDFLLFGFPKLAKRLRMRLTPKDIEKFYMDIVRNTIDYRKKNNINRNDFMDMLIELKDKYDAGNTSEGLSFEELAAQAFIFFIAGFETSSTTMGYVLYELARHQKIQDQLRTEINTVLAKHNNEFRYEAMKDMRYLEQIIDETLRMYPVVGNLVRVTQKRYETGNPNHFLDAGTTVIISALGIHYDPDIYPEPEVFKPERFTAEEIKVRPACAWLPFGEGPRNCIGMRFGKMQACIGLANLVKHFRFSIAPDTQIPMEFAKKNLLMSPLNGIYLKVEKIVM